MKEFHFGWKTGQFYDFCQEHLSYTTKKSESSENIMKKQHHHKCKLSNPRFLTLRLTCLEGFEL